jgi:hypothetical protein
MPPAPGIHSKRNLCQRKTRICGGVHEIRSRGDLTTPATGRAVDRSHQRDWTSHHRPHHSFEDCVLRLPALIGRTIALLEISTSAKRLLAAACDDHSAQAFQIDRERLEQFHEVKSHTRIQCVRHLGPIERDKKDLIVVPGNDDCLKISSHPILTSSAKPDILLVFG